jgi:hypothetical protein
MVLSTLTTMQQIRSAPIAPIYTSMSIMDVLLQFTFYTCSECSSYMKYEYHNKSYECEECGRKITDEDFYINWCEIKSFILNHWTPKKVIKMFIVNILEQEYWEPHIDKHLAELKTHNTFFGR